MWESNFDDRVITPEVVLGVAPMGVVCVLVKVRSGVVSRSVEVPRRVGKAGSVMSVSPRSWESCHKLRPAAELCL